MEIVVVVEVLFGLQKDWIGSSLDMKLGRSAKSMNLYK